MLVCAFSTHFGTRDRGCSAHPAFPAPSIFEGGKRICITRAKSRRENNFRRPGQASTASADPGPIRRGASCESAMVDGFASTTTDGGYGPRPSPGRRRSALRSMERLRNDALQTRDPGVWGCRDGSRLCGAPLKKRCTASGTREAGHDALWRLWAFPIPRKRIMVPDGSHPKVKLKSINIKGLRRA